MKWYCINKYIPQTGTKMLIRTIAANSYECFFIASLDIIDNRECLANWELTNDFAELNLDINDYQVTHFCPIDPVEDNQTKIINIYDH